MSTPLIRSSLFAAAIVFGAILIAFGALLPGEFVVDDVLWAAKAPSPFTAAEFAKAFGSWGFRDTSIAINGPPVYRPLQALFQKMIHTALGNTAWKLHLVSFALHALCGYLLWLVLNRLLPALDPFLRLLATTVFVLHPAGSEAVLWLSAMSELTVTSALLATFLLYLHWRDRWSPWRIACIGALGLAVCLWKETGIALPVLVIAFELGQQPLGKRLPWLPIAALVAAALVFLVLRHRVIGSMSGGQLLVFNPLRVLELALAHLRFLILPAAPSFALRPPEIALASGATIFGSLAVLAGAAWHCRRTGNAGTFAFGFVWLVVTLWPAYAVAMVGNGFFNGRQAYLASIGVALMLGALLNGLPPASRRLVGIAALALLPWMAASTATSALAWKSNSSVYAMAAQVSPNADGPRSGLAEALAARGEFPAALTRYAEALERAASLDARTLYLYEMARLHGQSGNSAEAERLLNEILALQPRNSFAWAGLGNLAWAAGQLPEAVAYYRQAVEADPRNYEATANLAAVLTASGPAAANEASIWRLRAMTLAARSKK